MVLYIVLGVIVVALIVLTIIFFRNKKKAAAAAAAGGEVVAPGGDDISVIIHEAENKLAAAKLEQGGKVSGLPVYLIMGEPGTTKTSVMLHSGLEPELLSGQVYQAGNVAPTRSVNLWFSRKSVFAEAGGAMLADGGKWSRLVKRLQPKTVVGKGEQAPRAAVVCFDCENFTKPGSADIVTNAARTLRARLGEISQAMGINLPVYALFTKTDRLPFFTEYVRNLTNDESTQVLGVTLPMTGRRSEGVYAEEETTRLTGQFERLFRSLADARIEFLAREGDATKLPPAYEFPREFRKIRPNLVQFLVDLCRPSQLTVGPFLRGFYFTGVRPILVNETAPVAAAPQAQAYGGGPAGATGIFSARAVQAANPAAPPPVIGTRKVPQWLFLAHLFNDILLADHGAMGFSGSSTKTSSARRWLFIAAASLCFLLCVLFTISFFNNRALETRVRDAAQGITSVGSSGTDVASLDVLRRLETLRQSLETLVKYRREGAPTMYRWGLYVGNDLYPETRRIYFDRFKLAMFGQTQNALLQNLKSLPGAAVPEHDYQPTYDSLKAYLITTDHHEKSTKLFLTPTLTTWWTGPRSVDPERVALAQKQFDFYAEELKEDNPYSSENDSQAIARGRAYLRLFAASEKVYNFMLAEADKVGKPVNFNRDFPDSRSAVINGKDIRGAFSPGGFKFMTDNLSHLDRYLSGETWVLGDQGAATLDMAALQRDLKLRYSNDWIEAWKGYIKATNVLRYAGLKDAANKLKQHASNTAPILELSSQASQNTNVADPNSKLFQPVQFTTPPEITDRFVGPANQAYISALAQLQASIETLADQPTNDAMAASTLQQARQAESTVGALANSFLPGSPIQAEFRKILTDPITNAIAALPKPGGDLNAKAGAMCAEITPIFLKYPFKPGAQVQATIPEIDQVFNPKTGVIWQFYEQSLKTVLSRQGAHFAAIPGPINVSQAFLSFMNHAGEFTEVAYPGGAGPKFNYQVKPEITPETQAIRLTIDGQSAAFSASNSGAKPFLWPGATQGVQLGVTFQGGRDFDVASYQGIWGVFQLVSQANKRVGNVIERTLTTGIPPQPITVPGTGLPVTVRLEMIANPNIFLPGYFAFTCSSRVTQ